MANRFPVNLKFNKGARNKILRGINAVANSVKVTLGPKGRNVAINEASGTPRIIHDGVGVAKRIDLFDEFEDMGAQLLKEAAIKTNEVAGDGTTTATIIAQFLVNRGLEDIAAGKNPMTLKGELEEASRFVIKELKKLAREVRGQKDIERVATISSADPKIGKIVAEAIKKTGDLGIIRVEMGKGFETTVEYKNGMEIDRGYYSPYFVTDQERVEGVVEDAYILMTDIKINHNYQIVPFLESFLKRVSNLVIIGEVQEEALATLVVNKLKGSIKVLAIQPPAFGDRRIDELEDISSLVGGQVILQESGRELKSVVIEELGRANKVIADRDKTIIQGAMGDGARLKERTNDLKRQIEIANTEFDEGIKRERLAKLVGGIAVINVGGITEVELADKKERIIDAVSSAKASVEGGILAGGQISFMTISQINGWPETLGATILREAIKQPFRVLIENTGRDYAETLGKITPIKYPVAIDVQDGQVKDMIESGIIDPLKVTRSALENAVSVAGMIWTTEVLISQPYKNGD